MATYGWTRTIETNIFDADAHVVITLYKLSPDRKEWLYEDSWWFAEGLFSHNIANWRAEERIRTLVEIYHARAL